MMNENMSQLYLKCDEQRVTWGADVLDKGWYETAEAASK